MPARCPVYKNPDEARFPGMYGGAYKAHHLAPSLYTSRLCYSGCEIVSYAEESVYMSRGDDQLKNMDKAKPTEHLFMKQLVSMKNGQVWPPSTWCRYSIVSRTQECKCNCP